jgi:hemerythrin-like domain-containing protein
VTQSALQIIRAEHRALTSVLQAMLDLATRMAGSPTQSDFAALRAIVFYIDEFPERLHHTKESDLLFPMVLRAAPEAAQAIARLDAEHETGERAIRDLAHELIAWEQMGEARRARFVDAARRYVDFYRKHLELEETQILPLAQRALDAAQWRELDAAFEANRDPLTGHEPEEAYRALFSRIVRLTPAPIGLGAARAAGS